MDKNQHHRGGFGSSIGFLLSAIGSAVGLGNIWGFPYKMGANGGFAFLIVYVILALAVGLPLLVAEISIGRKTGLSTIKAYRKMDGKMTPLGYMGVVSGTLVVMFYCVLGGLCMRYCVGFFVNIFGADGFGAASEVFYQTFSQDRASMILYTFLFALLTGVILLGGVQGGIEKFSSVVMPILFVLIVALVIYVARQPGAGAGYAFMFTPDWTYLKENFFTVLSTAAGQMFFSLSLAMGIMVTYGSYLKKEENIPRDAAIICGADTLFAMLAGCLVIPAAFAFVGEDAYMSGVKLLFVTMHQVFVNIGGVLGNVLGCLFFLAVCIAAFTSSVSLLEVSVSAIVDHRRDKNKDPKRKTVIMLCTLMVFVGALPVALDALGGTASATPLAVLRNIMPNLQPRVWNLAFLDAYDFLSEGFLMPLGALLLSIFVGYRLKTKTVAEECGIQKTGVLEVCYKFVVPVIMVVVLYGQISSFLA